MAFSGTSPTLLTSRGVSLPQSFGFSLLACSSYHWQLSFLRAEQVLLEQLDEDGGCRRKCFQALRQMKEDVWCPGTRPVITSYHLQVSGRPQRRGAGAGWVSLQCVCVCVCVCVEKQPQCVPTAALPRVPVFSSFRLLPSFFRFPSSLTPFLYCLLCLSLSPYFTQQTNPSAHCVPATLLRFRNELQHAFSTPEKSTVW